MRLAIARFFEESSYLEKNIASFLANPKNIRFNIDEKLPETADIEAIYKALNNMAGTNDDEVAQITAIQTRIQEFDQRVKDNLSERMRTILVRRTITLGKLAGYLIDRKGMIAELLPDSAKAGLHCFFNHANTSAEPFAGLTVNRSQLFQEPKSKPSSLIPEPTNEDINRRMERVVKKNELPLLISLLDADTKKTLETAVKPAVVAAGGGAAAAVGSTQRTIFASKALSYQKQQKINDDASAALLENDDHRNNSYGTTASPFRHRQHEI